MAKITYDVSSSNLPVNVRLLDEANNVVTQQSHQTSGNYFFDNVADGRYKLDASDNLQGCTKSTAFFDVVTEGGGGGTPVDTNTYLNFNDSQLSSTQGNCNGTNFNLIINRLRFWLTDATGNNVTLTENVDITIRHHVSGTYSYEEDAVITIVAGQNEVVIDYTLDDLQDEGQGCVRNQEWYSDIISISPSTVVVRP